MVKHQKRKKVLYLRQKIVYNNEHLTPASQSIFGGIILDRRYGFIHEKLDIKILILYVIRRLPGPVDIESLADAVLCDDGISYFDFADCLAELVETGHITYEDDKYLITEKGITNSQITESSLPFTVRVLAEKNAAQLATVLSRDLSIKTSHISRGDGGYTVSLSLSDGKGPIISMSLLTSTEEECVKIEKKFRKKAEAFYGEIIEMMLFND